MEDTFEKLYKIKSPEDLRLLPISELSTLVDELRNYIIEIISKNPGHLGAALGVLELTVALHYVFDTPSDKIVWDVGHQAYAHKILTGRCKDFINNRKQNGISGFPKMKESPYDCFGTGHSSTSISAVLGMAISAQLQDNKTRQHIAVIGDGAMTGGMAMEALNHAGVSNTNILVILNDNGIAIDKNEGALSKYLVSITTSRSYNKLKDKVWSLMGRNKKYGKHSREIVKQIGGGLKSTLLRRSNLFEAFGMRYFGPVDGHDINLLVELLEDLKKINGPKLLHVITTKGKGFEQAETKQTLFHAPGKFDSKTGEIISSGSKEKQAPKFQDVFGETLVELAKENDKIVGITPAMPTGSSMNIMMNAMPDRAFDVGIAEQHAVTLSAGFATDGLTPFCNIYSTFMQRAYDQVIHDVALQNLRVVFCLDRGGLVGEDGATHHGVFDLAYFRPIPNLTICSPLNEVELRNMMYTAQLDESATTVIRYPRGKGRMVDWKKPFEKMPVGKGKQLINGENIAFISIGPIGNIVADACQELNKIDIFPSLYNIRYLKPIDTEMLSNIFKKYKYVITIEDGVKIGGLGSAVIEFANENNYNNTQIITLGIPDYFVEQGSVEELYKECGLDKESIINIVKRL